VPQSTAPANAVQALTTIAEKKIDWATVEKQ
jgi:hypothetical protein